MTRLRLHIDRLVLNGYRHEDRHALAASLQEELTRRLSIPGEASRLVATGTTAGAPAGTAGVTVRLRAAETAAGVGRAVARGIVPGSGR